MPPDSRFDIAAALLRTSLAAMWLSHAWLKFGIFTMAGFAGFLAQQGLPTALAWPIVLAEAGGGLMILLGWHGPRASLALLPILLGALAIHAPNGWVFTAAGGGWEYPLFLAAMSLVHVLIGDGRLAVPLPGWPRAQAPVPTVRY